MILNTFFDRISLILGKSCMSIEIVIL